MRIEVCKGVAGLALYVDDLRVAGPRHNGAMEIVMSANVPPKQSARHASSEPYDNWTDDELESEIERLKAVRANIERIIEDMIDKRIRLRKRSEFPVANATQQG